MKPYANQILLTGGNGFLGSTIFKHLPNDKVTKLGIKNVDILADITKEFFGLPAFDYVIHSAGKAHSVPKTEAEKQAFFDVNVKGTQNLLKALESATALPHSFVFISSVAVYGLERGKNIDENEPLKAKDPYGLSKIKAEVLVQEWCAKHGIVCGILRLPLLVGKNPPGNLAAMIKGIKKGYYFNIAGGKARKSMVLAEDVVAVIPKVAGIGGVYNLTDGYHPSFYELSLNIAMQLGKNRVLNMPRPIGVFLATVGNVISKFPINKSKLDKITSDLTFSDAKARRELGWNPSPVLKTFKIK